MKTKLLFFTFLLSIIGVSCSNEETKEVTKENDVTIFTDFVRDVKTLKDYKRTDAIKKMHEIAKVESQKTIPLNKSNIKSFLEGAKDYSYCIIFVSNHTLVKVDDFNNCKQSGSWGVCMPKGEGYVIKGKWNYKEDYINNIIGRADDGQKRVAYLFR